VPYTAAEERSWPVSRILYLCDDLSTRPTRRVRGPHHPLPIWPCFQRGLHGGRLPGPPVSSYLTISPLPRQVEAVCFCCTFRRVAPPRLAPGAVPYEVRTFLPRFGRTGESKRRRNGAGFCFPSPFPRFVVSPAPPERGPSPGQLLLILRQ
jgi:hypothetical protein